MAIAWLASVRIGVLAALLLGPAAAIGVGARVPGLVTGPRDGFVVAAYLGLLFGAAMQRRRVRDQPGSWRIGWRATHDRGTGARPGAAPPARLFRLRASRT